jgi:uncharacterized membrane protein YebE (DUF533 family)
MMTGLRDMLDGLLQQGRGLADRAEDAAASRLGVGDDPDARRQMRQTALGAGAAAGVLGLLLGSRGGRRMLGRGAAIGGVAMLGKMAYDAWNRRDTDAVPLADADEADADRRAETLLWAMVAAARADGRIDDDEQARIDAALRDLPLPIRANLTTVMMRAPDPDAIARRAGSDQERGEIYAASVLMSGTDDRA